MNRVPFSFLAADTARSRCYVQALRQRGLRPDSAVLIPPPGGGGTHGQARARIAPEEFTWNELVFRPNETIEHTLNDWGIPGIQLPSHDLNSAEAVSFLASRPEPLFIFSGFGGVILRKEILALPKRFLHVHGGYLPAYKGSTTNYYSAIRDRRCGASSIYLTTEIDSGPVLMREEFPMPARMELLDYIYDPLFRAAVLVKTIAGIEERGSTEPSTIDNSGGEVFYVMHPVLRHIAALMQ